MAYSSTSSATKVWRWRPRQFRPAKAHIMAFTAAILKATESYSCEQSKKQPLQVHNQRRTYWKPEEKTHDPSRSSDSFSCYRYVGKGLSLIRLVCDTVPAPVDIFDVIWYGFDICWLILIRVCGWQGIAWLRPRPVGMTGDFDSEGLKMCRKSCGKLGSGWLRMAEANLTFHGQIGKAGIRGTSATKEELRTWMDMTCYVTILVSRRQTAFLHVIHSHAFLVEI